VAKGGGIKAASKLFLQAFPNLGLFSSKDFQRKLWRFCGISRGCEGRRPKKSQIFRGGGPPFDRVLAQSRRVPQAREAWAAICIAGDREDFMGVKPVLTERS
jgi:hypothetical protein